MRRVLALVLAVWGGLAMAPAVLAQDRALIISNEFYQNQPRFRGTRTIVDLERDFRDAGFEVQRLGNTRSNFSEAAAARLWRWLSKADKLVIVVSGQVVRANGVPWLLHTDAERPNSLSIGRSGLPLRPLLAFAAKRPGDAVIAIAENTDKLSLGRGVAKGYRPRDIPQGVTVVWGGPDQVAAFVAGDLLRPGRALAQAAKEAPEGLRIDGYVPASRAFLAARSGGDAKAAIERDFWRRTRERNTLNAFEQYLTRYPNGAYVAEARRRADALRLTPQDRARAAEEALGLNRDQRRAIQRGLTLLGFDTHGIDGILGRNSRQAISRWQSSVGVSDTGYLNANQVARIRSAAARRSEELRVEAERRQLEQERADRRFWNDSGAGGSERGLRRYLRRYPDGLHADEAREALKDIERDKRRLARAAEREAWDQAVILGTQESYEAYLAAYPDGRFVAEARARVASLRTPETPPDIVDAAKQEESRLSLNGFTRQLIEARLRQLDLDPGPADGKFTRETRRALRRYQRANSMPVTGFVTRDTIVRLLASAIDN